jgi:hypothetical protein
VGTPGTPSLYAPRMGRTAVSSYPAHRSPMEDRGGAGARRLTADSARTVARTGSGLPSDVGNGMRSRAMYARSELRSAARSAMTTPR